MKKILLFTVLLINVSLLKAQRFFYIDSTDKGAIFIKGNLKKSAQHLSKAQKESDCFIKTEVITTPIHTTIIKITMQDSATFKTIFEASEEYKFNSLTVSSTLLQTFYLKTIADRFTEQLIYCANRNNINTFMLLLKEKKDKT